MVNHLSGRIHLPPQATPDKFARESGGPLQNVARARQGGGRDANKLTQPTHATLREIAIGRIRPTH